MAEEEVLGEEEATATEEEESSSDGGGGLFDFSGGLMDSLAVKLLAGAIVLIAIILIVIGITNYVMEAWMVSSQPGKESEVSTSGPERRTRDPYATFEMENDFIVSKENPRTSRKKTLKLHIFLAFNPESGASELKTELAARKPQIRDQIYSILGSKSYERLSYEYQQELKDEIVSEVNKLLRTDYRVQEVFFSEFVVQ